MQGIINYIRDGGTQPSTEFVKAFQISWKGFAEDRVVRDSGVRDCGVQTVMGQDCHVLKNDTTDVFLAIKVESGESFTGYQLSQLQSDFHDNNGIIGKNYKN